MHVLQTQARVRVCVRTCVHVCSRKPACAYLSVSRVCVSGTKCTSPQESAESVHFLEAMLQLAHAIMHCLSPPVQ